MSYDCLWRFFPATVSLLQEQLPTVHDALFPQWAVEQCQGTPASVALFAGYRIKHPGLMPVAMMGCSLGFVVGVSTLLHLPHAVRGRFFVAWAYILYGCMNLVGTCLHCLTPVRPDMRGPWYTLLHGLDVGFTTTSCIALVLASLALLAVLDDRTQGMQRLVLTAFGLLIAACCQVSRFCLGVSGWHMINEGLYWGSVQTAAAVILLTAWQLRARRLLPPDVGRWLVLAVVCAVAVLPLGLADKYLCLYIGPHLNLLNLGYLVCVLDLIALYPFFGLVMAKAAEKED